MSLSDVDLAPFLSDAPPVPHDVWIEADMYAVFDDVQMLQLQAHSELWASINI